MISKRLHNFDSSAIQKAFALAATIKDPIDLSIGYPIENTPEPVKAAGIAAITENFTRYTASNGIPELRAALAAKLKKENNLSVDADQIAVTPGLTTAILIAYMALLDPGDEVLIADPHFPPYVSLAQLVGATAVTVNTYPDFQLTAARIEKCITPRSKVLVINTPSNPTGAIYPEAELRNIAALAKKHNLVIISDEIYEYYSYGAPHFSIGSIYPNTLTFNGFSKSHAMTGWRIGYIAGPAEAINAINQLLQYTVFSSSSIAQKAAIAALATRPSEMYESYSHKRDVTRSALGDFIDAGADGAFYAFIKTPPHVTDLQFCEQAVRHGVIVLPGSAFSSRNDYFRMAYVTDKTRLKKGLETIRSLLEWHND